MAELVTSLSQIPGQPSSVRIGLITSVNPTVVTVQGATFTDVGFLGSYTPIAGDTVALLGQCPASGSDPTSWLVLGSVSQGSGGSFQAGQVVMSFGPATSNLVAVSFQTPYLVVPSVATNIASGAGATGGWISRAINVTAFGFDLFVSGVLATWVAVPVQWQAQEQTQ